MADTLARTERAAYKAHIKSLEEQLAFMRGLLAPHQLVGQGIAPVMESGKLWTSEEEEEARELFDAGIIDQDELQSMLDATGAMSTDIDFAPTS